MGNVSIHVHRLMYSWVRLIRTK